MSRPGHSLRPHLLSRTGLIQTTESWTYHAVHILDVQPIIVNLGRRKKAVLSSTSMFMKYSVHTSSAMGPTKSGRGCVTQDKSRDKLRKRGKSVEETEDTGKAWSYSPAASSLKPRAAIEKRGASSPHVIRIKPQSAQSRLQVNWVRVFVLRCRDVLWAREAQYLEGVT